MGKEAAQVQAGKIGQAAGQGGSAGRRNPDAVKADVDLLQTVASQVAGKCLCPLGEFAVTPVLSGLSKFRSDFDGHTKDGKPAPAKPAAAARPAAKPAARKAEPTPAGD